jgi:hypothetical protein
MLSPESSELQQGVVAKFSRMGRRARLSQVTRNAIRVDATLSISKHKNRKYPT